MVSVRVRRARGFGVRGFGFLPQGAGLPAAEWRRRHLAIVRSVLACALGVAVFSAVQGDTGWHGMGESAIPVAIALLAWWLPLSQRLRASLASAALMVIAMLVVHLFGTIEAHFLFFIMVPVVALYEDWAPFATAAVLVFAHHAAAAFGDPRTVYNHQAAIESPLAWSLIHSGLFLGICVTSIVHWNIHEEARAGERALIKRLERLALHDPLTGLPNRELFDRRLAEALQRAARSGEPLALLMVDIDGLKRVNDMHGHAAGDLVLKAAAGRLRHCTRQRDTVARLGGDEFAVVLPGAGVAAAAQAAQRIIDAMSGTAAVGGADITVGASAGVAMYSAGQSPDQLMKDADQALYLAKRSGRGRYKVFGDRPSSPADGAVTVNVSDARDWALYVRLLRAEIAAVKESGALPAQTRGPESARRTLEELVASIDDLPRAAPEAPLCLPERPAVEEFLFHHGMVHAWADSLSAQGLLTVQRPGSADRFWSLLHAAVTGIPAMKPALPAPGRGREDKAPAGS